MALNIEPNVSQTAVVNHPICFTGSGNIVLPQEPAFVPLDIPASGSGWTYDSATKLLTRVGGAGWVYIYPDTPVVPDGRPFWVAFMNQTLLATYYSGQVGIMDDQDRTYAIEVVKDERGWIYNTTYQGQYVLSSVATTINRCFSVRFVGNHVVWDVGTGPPGSGTNLESHAMALPESETWRVFVGIAVAPNQMHLVSTRLGSYAGPIPITWSTPLGGTLTGEGNSRCFSADEPGAYEICIDSDYDDPLCVDIEVDDLYFNPIGFECDECTFVNTVVNFESNGGLEGTLIVTDPDDNPIGTVIDALTWQAPNYPTYAIATYTLGTDSRICEIRIVEDLKILNVEGDTILGLVPGSKFKILTNYELIENIIEDGGFDPDPPPPPLPNPELKFIVEWTNLDCQNLVSPDGYITIPKRYNDECFGAIDCYIRGTLKVTTINEQRVLCPNLTDGSVYKDIRIIVNPVYPTPEFGGPRWNKWKPEVPDFRVLTKTAEGGCTETHIRNRVPTMRWSVGYQGLTYESTVCPTEPCCDETAGFVGGYDPKFQTAKMLDDFWMLVAGQYGAFTLIEPRTGEIWQNVRFENKMDRDHSRWSTIQNRNLTLIWSPCCDGGPIGGMCIHRNTIIDNIIPTIPQNIAATPISGTRIDVTWEASLDNVGIDYYELEIDGVVVNVGNVLLYHNIHLQPNTTHFYKVRAVDFANNPSEWSTEISATTVEEGEVPVLEGTVEVYEAGDQVIEG